MATRRTNSEVVPAAPRRPARTPEARENQLVEAAVNLAEKQILDGSASAQVITHFLKLGSSREGLEQERLRNENILLRAKKEQLDSQARIENLIGDALTAMRSYVNGSPPDLELEGDDDFYDD